MTGASRFNSSRFNSINSNDRSSDGSGQVIRPVISRWLPGWVKSFRQNQHASKSDPSNAGVVHFLPLADIFPDIVDTNTSGLLQQVPDRSGNAVRIRELREQVADIVSASNEWIGRGQALQTDLQQARAQHRAAADRLAITGEPLPGEKTGQLTSLQASYLNFSMALELQEQKLAEAIQKISGFREKHASLCAEATALADNQCDDDEFRQAA